MGSADDDPAIPELSPAQWRTWRCHPSLEPFVWDRPYAASLGEEPPKASMLNQSPNDSRLASLAGRPAASIAEAVASMSYATRSHRATPASVSRTM